MVRKTNTKERILDFIRVFRRDKGYSPSVREVASHCGIKSPSVVQYHLEQLLEAGLITKDKVRSRSIGLVGDEEGPAQVPLLGVIAAGQPIDIPSVDSQKAGHRMIDVPRDIMRNGRKLFALQVRGNSMVDAMIADADILIMEQADSVNNGDVAACWLENEQEVTLKKIYYEKGQKIRLQPCNPYMLPLFHDAANIRIQGKVVAVLRTKM
ncbi:MAG: transcriptional repressor LexA [Syntrophorhabdaceae bacterium]|nr:transcriptional repressor LexA [Syntrophorhabdaceae bacterium]MDD4196104.1 transcriptional repressor LexA [Syntrophorhabdaceae bacterium]HOC45027.1 transcriptional repressor LexA [Syntrophorhabdaceae bacterium]